MGHLLAWLEQHGVQQVLLDASQMGQPLYEKLDFTAFDEIYALQRHPASQPFSAQAKCRSYHKKIWV